GRLCRRSAGEADAAGRGRPPSRLHADSRAGHRLAHQSVRRRIRRDWQERILGAFLLAGVTERPVRPGWSFLLTRQAAGLLLIAGLAWLAVIAQARGMSAMGATMGLGLLAFVGVWTLMMGAMMLPSVAPVAVLYERSVTENRVPRLVSFAAGYIIVWGLAGVPAFGLAVLLSSVAMDHPQTARFMAAGIFLILGLYQVSPLKNVCLRHCRSPL